MLTVHVSPGFDGRALVASASDADVKTQLRINTQRAIDAGACGVPSFQVDGGPLIWGQDRWSTVSDMLDGWSPPTIREELDGPEREVRSRL